jgi:hypothetical protein
MTSGIKTLLQIISYAGLAMSIVPALLVYHGSISMDAYYKLMVLGMVLWFGSAIFWIKPEQLGE